MFLVRTFVLICCLAVPLFAHGAAQPDPVKNAETSYAQIDLKEFAAHPAEFEGRRIAVTADIVSVGADLRTVNIFDNESKALVGVSLGQLSKAQRQSLANEPVHRVSVYGRVEVKNGRAIIKADQVMPLATNLMAQK